MKTVINRICFVLMAMLMLALAVVPVLADAYVFDLEAAIADFSETAINTRSLTVGQTDSPLGSNWVSVPNAQILISDPEVIKINSQGVVTALAEGVAYVAIVPNEYMFEITCYKVGAAVAEKTQVHKVESMEDLASKADFIKKKDGFGMFGVVAIGGAVFAVFFVFVLVLLVMSAKKAKALDQAMQQIVSLPCQESAEIAVREFSNINALVRFNLSMGGDSRGVHFTMWREVFNHTVIPCQTIRPETKEALRKALVDLNTHSLHPVYSQK